VAIRRGNANSSGYTNSCDLAVDGCQILFIQEEPLMAYQFKDRDELQQFIAKEVLTTPEALEYLGITRQALNSLVHRGKIKPIKDFKGTRLFLKADLGERKVEAEKLKKKYRPYD
jgi:hypothetical protein